MFQISANFAVAKFDLNAYRRALASELLGHVHEAAKQYIRAVAFEIIPVWSGASVATFLKLAAEIGYALPISSVPTAPNRVGKGKAMSEGVLLEDVAGGRFHFLYSTSLPHLIFNEYRDANAELGLNLHRPGPYRFQQVGRAVFMAYTTKVRLPNPIFYQKIVRITV